MVEAASLAIDLASADELERSLPDLAALLHATVHAGASVGFILPFALDDALAFWRQRVLPGAAAGTVLCWTARLDKMLAGTVQLDIGTPPNQPHRAEVRKLLVHPDRRRRGIARALMSVLEAHAASIGRHLLTLDTRTGDVAEPLYASLGYRTVGPIPGYCLDPSAGRLDATTIMYKRL
jgi:ribosomal protein S18 acetylase RimI-like enzyme